MAHAVRELLALVGSDLEVAAAAAGVVSVHREAVLGYGALRDLDVVEAAAGVRFYLRRGEDEVVLVYIGPAGLPDGLADEDMQVIAGGEGDWLRSRQGKTAGLHVAADKGVAWSDDHGVVGFVELFRPTTLEAYLNEIYEEPPTFVQ